MITGSAAQVEHYAPADVAGVRRGDILVALDGEAVTGVDDIARLLDDSRIGLQAAMTIVRNGAPSTVSITPMER